MYELTCYDVDGNIVNHLTQWDVDQKLIITVKGFEKSYLSIAPNIHFGNAKRTEALVVRSTVTNGDTITVDIPNVLLQEPLPLLVYIYVTDADDVSSQKTILSTEIPVRKRPKPSNYSYVENIERITANQIKKEIKQELVNDINKADLSFERVTFVDDSTKAFYQVYVNNGQLYMDRVKTEDMPLERVTFIDQTTGVRHGVSVNNGKMILTLGAK